MRYHYTFESPEPVYETLAEQRYWMVRESLRLLNESVKGYL